MHVGNVSPLSHILKLCGPLPRGKMHELFFELDKKNIPPVSIDNGVRLATNSKDSDQISESMRGLCRQVSPTQSNGGLSNGLVLSNCDSWSSSFCCTGFKHPANHSRSVRGDCGHDLIRRDHPSVSKCSQLHVDIVWFFFVDLGYILWIPPKWWWVIFLKTWTSTGHTAAGSMKSKMISEAIHQSLRPNRFFYSSWAGSLHSCFWSEWKCSQNWCLDGILLHKIIAWKSAIKEQYRHGVLCNDGFCVVAASLLFFAVVQVSCSEVLLNLHLCGGIVLLGWWT